ncbi:MAG: LD-carboxypeptidase [Candidatus Enteromonas sp.]
MRQPPFLKDHDAILMVAPSFGVTTEPYLTRYLASKKNLEKEGFRVVEGPCVHLEEGVAASASPEARAKEIMDAFRGDAPLVLSVGGGETMCEILPHLDFSEIASLPPKWFMGFSDNTNLCFPLATLADTISIYGPCGPQFYARPFRGPEKDALALLRGEKHAEGYPKFTKTRSNPDHPLWRYRLTQEKIIEAHGYEGPVSGTLLGGCLDCLLGLCGTKFDAVKKWNENHPEGTIWFLEACDLSPLGIRRGLFQLKEAGWFDNANMFLIGRPLCRDAEMFGVDKRDAVLDILGPLGVPILLDVDLGHIAPSLPIKVGAKATVSFAVGNLVYDYEE